jgi:hypothetical protein
MWLIGVDVSGVIRGNGFAAIGVWCESDCVSDVCDELVCCESVCEESVCCESVCVCDVCEE